MKTKYLIITLLFLSPFLMISCGGSSSGSSDTAVTLPDVSAATFGATDEIDNPYLPLPVGASWVYEVTTAAGLERIDVSVTNDTRQIQGVTAVVVRDTVTVDGEIKEDTFDWYAQDSEGNVWYLGEDTCVYENGECVDTEGSWEWGVDGALPGIAMPADPTANGETYYQEYYLGHAEDVGEVVAVNESVTVAAGTFTDCIKTHDTSTLELDVSEFKFYCRGVGVVKAVEEVEDEAEEDDDEGEDEADEEEGDDDEGDDEGDEDENDDEDDETEELIEYGGL